MTNYSRAKEIFFRYSSSKFQMMRDGFSAEYYSFQVPDNIEAEWLIELIKQELHKLNINNVETLFPLWYILETNCNIDYLQDIIDFIENNSNKVDDEFKLLIFTKKVIETIDRIESSCSKISSSELDKYRKKLKAIRKE